jgi:Dihydrofolate reductase
VTKYVASTTLQAPEWANTTVLNGDLAEAVTKVKQATERTILMHGYGPVAKTLVRHGLVDELVLWVHPVLAGVGTPSDMLISDGLNARLTWPMSRPSAQASSSSATGPAHDDEENVMNYHGLVKRLDLPAGWVPPTELEYDDIRARAISRADNDDDVQGINASIELIRRTRGGSWPTEPSASTSTSSMRSGTNASSAKATRSPTPCTTRAATTSGAATCTRWGGAPPSPRNCSRTTST